MAKYAEEFDTSQCIPAKLGWGGPAPWLETSCFWEVLSITVGSSWHSRSLKRWPLAPPSTRASVMWICPRCRAGLSGMDSTSHWIRSIWRSCPGSRLWALVMHSTRALMMSTCRTTCGTWVWGRTLEACSEWCCLLLFRLWSAQLEAWKVFIYQDSKTWVCGKLPIWSWWIYQLDWSLWA